MHVFFSISYFIILIISISCLFAVIMRRQRTSESHTLSGTLQMVLVFIVISMVGYTMRMVAATSEEYIFGEKFILLGGSFLYYFLLCFYRRLCGAKIPRGMLFVLAFIGCFFSGATFTFDHHTVVFKHFTPLVTESGVYGNARYEFGFVFYAYMAMLAFYALALLIMAVSNVWMSRKKRRRVTSYMLLAIALCCPFVPLIIESVFKTQYDIVPFGILICALILIYLLYIEKIHDIADMAREFVFSSVEDGLIILDDDNLYSGCNDRAIAIFPELANLTKGQHLGDISERLGKIVSGEITELNIGDVYYEILIKKVMSNKTLAGSVIWVTDVTERRKHLELMSNYQSQLEQEVKVKTSNIEHMRDRLVVNIANMIENRDNPTGGHVKRTSDVVAIFIHSMMKENEFGLTSEFYDAVIKTAPMHDLGKMAVDDRILLKPGKFTPEEFEVMKTHTTKGAGFVASVLEDVNEQRVVRVAENIAHYHHEKWNGQGYPEHLKGDEIPIEARIMAIADVYDALVSKRCYKDKMSFDQAYDIIIDSMGSHFDPKLEKYFVSCRSELENYYSSIDD